MHFIGYRSGEFNESMAASEDAREDHFHGLEQEGMGRNLPRIVLKLGAEEL